MNQEEDENEERKVVTERSIVVPLHTVSRFISISYSNEDYHRRSDSYCRSTLTPHSRASIWMTNFWNQI
jgi:hypothetical protein